MTHLVEPLLWLLVIGAALYGLHRLTLPSAKMPENRTTTAVGNVMADLHGLLSPRAKHVIEVKRENKKEQDDSGDPPSPKAALKSV